MKRRAFLMILAVLTLQLAVSPYARALDKVRFATSVVVPMYELPLLVAEEKGLWKENGLEGVWVSFRAGAELSRAMSARAIDMGLSTAATTIQSITRGVPEVIVAVTVPEDDFFLWVQRGSSIKGAKDLRGTRIAVTRFGGIDHAYGLMLAKNLRLGKELKLIATGGVLESLAAMKAGHIDGQFRSLPTMVALKSKGEVREVMAIKEYLPSPWINQLIASRVDFAESSSETLRKTIKTLFQSMAFILKNRPWAVEKMKSRYGFSDEVAQGVYEAFGYSQEARVDVKAVENVRNFLIEYAIIRKDEAPPTDKLYTTRFVE